MKKNHPFPPSIIFILSLFSAILVLVIAAAYSRRSGNTNLEISKMHQLRYESIYKDNQTAAK